MRRAPIAPPAAAPMMVAVGGAESDAGGGLGGSEGDGGEDGGGWHEGKSKEPEVVVGAAMIRCIAVMVPDASVWVKGWQVPSSSGPLEPCEYAFGFVQVSQMRSQPVVYVSI